MDSKRRLNQYNSSKIINDQNRANCHQIPTRFTQSPQHQHYGYYPSFELDDNYDSVPQSKRVSFSDFVSTISPNSVRGRQLSNHRKENQYNSNYDIPRRNHSSDKNSHHSHSSNKTCPNKKETHSSKTSSHHSTLRNSHHHSHSHSSSHSKQSHSHRSRSLTPAEKAEERRRKFERKILNQFIHLQYPFEPDNSKALDAMSQHSEEGTLIASSESFWEPGNYKKSLKRIEDGHKLCNDLVDLVQERADIEKAYARSLKSWSKKWSDNIIRGPEYGTMEAAWKGILAEADRLSEVHSVIKEDLESEVISTIRAWQKENFHKNMLSLKEKKEMDDLFKNAQKPWGKLLTKVNKAKNDYHNTCKTEKTLKNQINNASNEGSLSSEQLRKLQDKVERLRDERHRLKGRYEDALKEITQDNPRYIQEMRDVFEKCQINEKTRLEFFKKILFGIHKCVNISDCPELSQIYDEFHHTINNADSEKDLKWWSHNHGANMAMDWPIFEEFTDEFRELSSRNKLKLDPNRIMLIKQKTIIDETDESFDKEDSDSNRMSLKSGKKSNNYEDYNRNISKMDSRQDSFNDEDEENNNLEDEEDDVEQVVTVRALFSYEKTEEDELSFSKGDIFEKLEEEDDQGWCKGRINGKVGLYPANYCEEVN